MEEVIKIENLYKSFGDVKAVNDLSLRVKQGELFAFLGINGAGKSTTISMMCGNLKIDSGKIYVCGKDVSKESNFIKKQIGVVFQDSVLDESLSVYDNLKYRAGLYGIVGEEFKKKYNELEPNCHELNQAAISRIKEYTQTAGIAFQLLHTEIAVYTVNNSKSKYHGLVKAFRDHDVHNVLKRSGINNKNFHGGK